MGITVKPVATTEELNVFVRFPWQVYRNDPYWVPPLIDDLKSKLVKDQNQFWSSNDQQCWVAYENDEASGRICALVEKTETGFSKIGYFGFFECENKPLVAEALFSTAEAWLQQRGAELVRGPVNPSLNEEPGFLVEGFNIRPVLMAAHTPPYYLDLITSCGYQKYNDLVARRYILDRKLPFNSVCPEKILRIAARVEKRPDIRIRRLNVKDWDNEISLACDIFNKSLAHLKDYVPVSQEEFHRISSDLRQIINPGMALIAEVNNHPVGYALAYPDMNQALQKANGKVNFLRLLRIFFETLRLDRVSFKILMILPEYQGRGIESLLIREVGKEIWRKRYKEVDMSLAGEENFNSNRFQSHLGFETYLRYRLFEKRLIKE
jgi:GNAT superfamily N-acetyltransferase